MDILNKMMMKKIIMFSIALMYNLTGYGQKISYKRLEVGDTIPNISLTYSINGKQVSKSMSAFKGKMVLLDFWNIWCSSCIAAMPHMVSLQQKYPDKLEVFLVTNNNQNQIDKQFKAIASRTNYYNLILGLPKDVNSIVGDSILHQLFPHKSVPHHIWIDKNGVVKYIARLSDATEENIEKFIAEKPLNLVAKKDTGFFDHKKPLYLDANYRQMPNLKYYSMIFTQVEEVGNTRKSEEVDTVNQVYRFRVINNLITNLFLEPTRNQYRQKFYNKNRLVLEVKDSSKIVVPTVDSIQSRWRTKNLWCYDMAIPLSERSRKDQIMATDLNKFMPYYGRIEKRVVKTLALTRYKKTDSLMADANEAKYIRQYENLSFELRGGTTNDLIERGLCMIDESSKIPVVDDTGIIGKIHIRLTKSDDLNTTRKDLRKYGLDLVEKNLETELFVISDK